MNLGYIKKRSLATLDSDYYVPHTNKTRRVFKYIILVSFSICVLFLRIYFLDSFGGYKNTYIIFYPALVLSALIGGFFPGLTATLIFASGTIYYLIYPYNTFYIYAWEDNIALIIFSLSGFCISVICEALQREQRRSYQKTTQLFSVGAELKKAKEELHTILQNVADGIIVRDSQGQPVYANPTALTLYGYEGKRNKFLTLRELSKNFEIQDESGTRYTWRNMPVGKILHGEKEAEATLYFRNKKTEKEFWSISRARGIYDVHGRLELVVTVFADITQRRKLERQKDEFIGIASHELKTPVTSLKGYVQVLQTRFNKEGDSKSAGYMAKMDSQINKLTLLIQDLLDVTKIEKGKLQFHRDYFDFNTLVNEIVEELQRTTEKHQIITELQETRDVFGDRDRIGQVMINFLSNAIKYSPQSDSILVRTHVEPDTITYAVEDFGIGIAEDNRKKVFERFFRINEGRQETFPGMGLGLYISTEIIQRHQGKIWVESEKDKGSTFYFSLPIKVQTYT